jgi:hypothetical protein
MSKLLERSAGSGSLRAGEDDKSASAGVGFRKGNLRPHSSLAREIADPRI